MYKIAPSILASDFGKLAEEIKDVEAGGADYIHIDIMDGHFVPNISMGPLIVEAVRKVTNLPLDVHLMIEEPSRYIEDFANAGADFISVHVEADRHIHRTIQQIKELGVKAGIVLNPGTPAQAIEQVLEEVEMVLVMTVNPGFGGQTFLYGMLNKIEQIKKMIDDRNLHIDIEVDGGINADTAFLCKQAGANILVAGSSIFNEADRHQAIQLIRSKLEE